MGRPSLFVALNSEPIPAPSPAFPYFSKRIICGVDDTKTAPGSYPEPFSILFCFKHFTDLYIKV